MSFSRARRAALLTALVATGALTLSACGDGGKSGGGGDTNFVAASGGVETVRAPDRRLPNELKGETLDGSRLDIADLKGKVVVINVWGSWCAPCRAEAPHFAKVSKEKKADGVEFVGINTRDGAKRQAIAFEKDYGITYPSFYDPIGKLVVNGFPRGTLMPQGIPSTIVLDREGRIAARALREIDEAELRKMIDPLIAEK
ncbi:TlpA disulfide reductase family protein [Streptomyces sp. NPDC005805]|uniref:TlpA family protein disulfide reductase n=1 Tax=Streptomyces sp. NPDC005805 TaxID=3157068 RepID=UPI00340D9C72